MPKNGLGALTGAIGGIAGVLAMTALQLLFDHLRSSKAPRPVRELSQRGGGHDIARLKVRARRSHLPQRDATVRAAEGVASLVRARGLKPRHRHVAGVTVHYAFDAFVGAAYGWAVENNRTICAGFGLPFGAAVWLLAEEVALPLTGLSDEAAKYPLRDHFDALTAHLLFGSATELTRKSIRNALNFAGDRPSKPANPIFHGEALMSKRPVQIITSHSADEESAGQERVGG